MRAAGAMTDISLEGVAASMVETDGESIPASGETS